jgi:type I restriction enzyme S subunit
MDSKTFFDNFETITNAPGGIARLRELILDLAVRGKITEQISNERRLEIPESDGFFEIPNNWVWSALEEIADYGGRGNKSPSEIVDSDWVLDLEDIEKTTSRLLNRVRSKDRKTTSTKARFERGDVLYGKLRPYLDKVLVADTPGYCTTEIVPITPKFGLDPQWLRISLKSPMFIGYVTEKSYGMKMPRLGTKDAKASLHAVPPIEEQKRIVARVDELMALCDELEATQNLRNSIRTSARKSAIGAISVATSPEELEIAWKRISGNWLAIVDTPESIASLRSLILGLAVRGKLVPQIANEELLEAVTVNGKFELPNSWNWVKISTVTEFVNGFAFKSEEYCENGIGIVRMSDLKFGQIAVQGMKRVPEKYRSILDENLRVSPGDLVIGMSGSIGKPCFNLTGETFLLNQRVGKFVPHSVDKNYLAIVLQTLESSFLEMSAGSGIKNLSTKQIKDAELPLPPALEQKRIVTKVEELMTLCDQLEHSLIKRDELAKKIAVSLASEIAA